MEITTHYSHYHWLQDIILHVFVEHLDPVVTMKTMKTVMYHLIYLLQKCYEET